MNKQKSFRSSVGPTVVVLAAVLALCVAPAAATLVPGDSTGATGASVGAGVGTGVDVTVLNPRAIVDWNTLDTDAGQLLQFLRDGGLSGDFAVLNRVNDIKATDFQGELWGDAGGHIIIVNPHGIVFGPDSLVNASKFTASSLNFDGDFLTASDFTFVSDAQMAGQVVNEGTIVATKQAALLAQRVINKGSISCDNGTILMATGDKIVLGNQGSDILVEVKGVIPATPPAFQEMGDVINEGLLQADNGDIILAAGDAFAQAIAPVGVGRVEHSGTIDTTGDLRAGAVEEAIFAAGNTTIVDGAIKVKAGSGVTVKEDLVALSGEMIINSGGLVSTEFGANLESGLDMEVTSGDNHSISLTGTAESGRDMILDAGTYVFAGDDLVSGGRMEVTSGSDNISLSANAQSAENMDLNSGTDIYVMGDLTSDKNLTVTTGTSLSTIGTTYSMGNMKAAENVDLNTNLALSGGQWFEDIDSGWYIWGGQSVEAGDTLTAQGWISKDNPGELLLTGGADGLAVDLKSMVSTSGNMYIRGKGSVQVGDQLNATQSPMYGVPWPNVSAPVMWPADKGGVSVISEAGKIYTDGASPLNDTLAVGIFGYSDEITGSWQTEVPQEPAGVDLPYMDEEGNAQGLAAIVLQSHDTLKIDKNAALVASGYYLPADAGNGLPPLKPNGPRGVDNRPGIDFLAEDGVTITGFERDEGIPSDVAIYGASTTGNVIVDTDAIYVTEGDPGGGTSTNGYYFFDFGPATVVFDARDTVKLDGFIDELLFDLEKYGECFEPAGFRMEVASRRTEWLNEAIANGTLPFASEPEIMEELLGEDYVLRGADYPDNLDGKRAWVLEDQPPFADAAPLADMEYPKLKGCPVELQSVANELDVTREKLQMSIGSSLAMNPNIQACEACAKVIQAAAILKDVDGAYLAALNQVFGQLAPSNAPFTPEIAASVVVAFADMSNTNERPEYALAAAYVDAFVNYVAVLDGELGQPVGDSVAFVLAKHGGALMQNTNTNVSAFVTSRLAEIGG